MNQSVSNNISWAGSLAAAVFLAGAWICMFPPEGAVFRWWSDNALFVALGYLLMAIVFLIFNKFRLMFICLGCSAAVSFFYDRPETLSPPTTLYNIHHAPPPFLTYEHPQTPE